MQWESWGTDRFPTVSVSYARKSTSAVFSLRIDIVRLCYTLVLSICSLSPLILYSAFFSLLGAVSRSLSVNFRSLDLTRYWFIVKNFSVSLLCIHTANKFSSWFSMLVYSILNERLMIEQKGSPEKVNHFRRSVFELEKTNLGLLLKKFDW